MYIYPNGIPLPASSKYDHPARSPWGMPRRLKFTLVSVAILFCLGFVHLWRTTDVVPAALGLLSPQDPPTYGAWHTREVAMPQNNPDLPFPQGRNGSYLRFSNHLTTVGWGNSMQEMIMNAHLAWKSGRTYVFYNYTWDRHAKGDYSHFGANVIPARIPLTALVDGEVMLYFGSSIAGSAMWGCMCSVCSSCVLESIAY
ncbi:hypothetical protein OF83DRAFT_1176867 [Amylostereum chailletii]|nr:hypothetical protein OF83DRAFT_1176867 [Amylostereum chailletii]